MNIAMQRSVMTGSVSGSILSLTDLNTTTTTTAFSTIFNPADLYRIHRPSIVAIDRYITPIWYAVGFPGNILAFLVWTQPRMRHSSGCYLAALAATDCLFLVLHMIFELQSAWDVVVLNVPVLCEVFPVFFLAAQYMSPLFVLGFTTERYISVCHPYKRQKFCTTRGAVCVISAIVLFSLSLHVVQIYFWKYDSTTRECSPRPSVVEDGSWTAWATFTELLVFGLVPLSILTLNVCVIVEARRMSLKELKLFTTHRRALSPSRIHAPPPPPRTTFGATTVLLLAVSFYLIASTLPATVSYVIVFRFPQGSQSLPEDGVRDDVTWQSYFQYWLSRVIVQELCMSHYAGNFYIYLMTGRAFRVEFRRLFTRGLCARMGREGRTYEVRRSDGRSEYSMGALDVYLTDRNGSSARTEIMFR